MGSSPGKTDSTRSSHWLRVALHPGMGPWEYFTHPHGHVSCCGHHAGLTQATILLRLHRCSFSAKSWRHCPTAGILVPWCLQSFCPLFWDVPWAFSIGVVLQVFQLGLDAPWSLLLCILASCGSLLWSPSAAKETCLKRVQAVLICGHRTFRMQIEVCWSRKMAVLDSPLTSMTSPSMGLSWVYSTRHDFPPTEQVLCPIRQDWGTAAITVAVVTFCQANGCHGSEAFQLGQTIDYFVSWQLA